MKKIPVISVGYVVFRTMPSNKGRKSVRYLVGFFPYRWTMDIENARRLHLDNAKHVRDHLNSVDKYGHREIRFHIKRVLIG